MLPSKVARSAKPKLSLSITAATSTTTHSLPTPLSAVASPASPCAALTPTARNTRANQRGMCTYQAATYAYAQNPNTKSILRRGASASSVSSSRSSGSRRIQFCDEPEIHCITPVTYDDAEGGHYVPMTKENRWSRASYSD